MGYFNSIFKMWPDKNCVQGEKIIGDRDREGSFQEGLRGLPYGERVRSLVDEPPAFFLPSKLVERVNIAKDELLPINKSCLAFAVVG